jgi:flagellar biosynthesis/type III secretory pathway M-ring protein FliF/YscJ
MQPLQRTFQLIRSQLGALTPTAKLLIASMMVILVMALLFVAMLTSQPSMVPLPAILTAETKAKALSHLKASGVSFQELGDQVLVPAEQKYAIVSQLVDSQLISGDQIDFVTLVKQENPFGTREQNRKAWLSTKMKVLERMISKMNGIASAVVVIDEPLSTPGIGKAYTAPSATVTVITRGDGLAQHQVDAIASAVVGAHAGMKVANVAVIDANAGKTYQARDGDQIGVGKNLELKLETERIVQSKIEQLLAIPGMRVSVNAIVDSRREEKRIQEFQKPLIGPLESSTREQNSTSSSRGAEPAVVPNTGASIAAAGGTGSTLSESQARERTVPMFPNISSTIVDLKGHALMINVAIGIPRSFFDHIFKEERGDPAAKPDKAALDALVQSEEARIRQQVEPLILTAAVPDAVPGRISVSMIHDFANDAAGGVGAAAVTEADRIAGTSGGFATEGMVKYIGLGSLAFISLVMMVLMVRKANAREPLPTAAELVGVPKALEMTDGDLVGEADESSPALEGVELDDEELRKQQMLSQINEMIRSKPDEAASLVRKWIRTEN